MMLTVCSFYVDRRAEYPDAVDYVPLLLALNRSCHRLGFEHIVLSDCYTMERPSVRPTIRGSCLGYSAAGGLVIGPRGGPLSWHATDRPVFSASDPVPRSPHNRPALIRNLSQATPEAQARFLEERASFPLFETDFLFVGADCLIRRDFRDQLPAADLSIILRPGHKRHRVNNGFMFVPAASCAKVAPFFRRVADSCGEAMCDDMVALEAALAPMPDDYMLTERCGLTVNFLPMDVWNGGPKVVDDPAENSFVLHFRGRDRKRIMVEWAQRWLP